MPKKTKPPIPQTVNCIPSQRIHPKVFAGFLEDYTLVLTKSIIESIVQGLGYDRNDPKNKDEINKFIQLIEVIGQDIFRKESTDELNKIYQNLVTESEYYYSESQLN